MTLRTVCFFVLIQVVFGAKLLNCPLNNIKYEKVIGVRPSNTNHPLLLHRNDGNNINFPITTECVAKCNDNDQCRSFVIHYNSSTCYWFKNAIQGVQEALNEIDAGTAWFVKICLNVGDCGKLWIFERVPGATLIGNETKTLPGAVTRDECQQMCLSESSFGCRSASFRITQSTYGPNDEIRGICALSDADRHTKANSYRVARYDEEYFENQCTPLYTNDDQFCAYEEFDNITLAHRDVRYDKQTKETCQNLCDDTQEFNCRGYSISNGTCFLHSEDSKVLGPKSLLPIINGKYYEKAQCLNISIGCSETYMTVDYLPKFRFGGKIYMQGYSEHPECYSRGSGFGLVTLKLPMLTNQCGIITATTGTYNRTLKTGTMILQYNPFVQTQGDRIIRIGCIFNNDSKTVVGTGITISSNLSNTGSTLFNSSNSAKPPTIEMRVVDFNTQEEVSDTQIGQDLQLIIEIKPANGNLDIWAGHLVAMTEKSDESILLLDDRGCPTNPGIFPKLSEIYNNETRRLAATFQAFKFSASPVVRFSVIVQFCPEVCPPVVCNNVPSAARSRRKILPQPIQTINSTTITLVNRSDFESTLSRVSLPLEFIIVVRNPDARSDRLVLGDHKILVAGYDYVTNEVCLDYSLFVGITITWLLIQIIFVICCLCLIKRYKRHYENEHNRQSLEELHKNFGIGFSNLDNRRVRWADNGDLT